MPIAKRAVAELLGTFWLVFGGCGSAVLAAKFPEVGIGLVGVSLAFGLTVVTMAYAVGHISGGHFNPAITLGTFAAGRTPAADVVPYIIAQLIGAVLAAWLLATIARAMAPMRSPPASRPMVSANTRPATTRRAPHSSPKC